MPRSSRERMRRVGPAVLVAGVTCFATLALGSRAANAVDLFWSTGVWGNTWQVQPTSASDLDGDGVANAMDAFPTNIAEWGDFDGDGIGDFGDIDDDDDGILDFPDPDDDNDGLADIDESIFGSDPLNADTDGDGIGDGAEVALRRDPTVNEPAALMGVIQMMLRD